MIRIAIIVLLIFAPVPVMAKFSRAIGGSARWPVFVTLVLYWLGPIALLASQLFLPREMAE